MASISTDRAGNRTIQFVGTDRKRRSIRLGKVSMKFAEKVCTAVEDLNAARLLNESPPERAVIWLKGIGDPLHARLAAVGLCEPRGGRASPTVMEFIDQFLASKPHLKTTTTRTFRVALNRLAEAVGPCKRLSTLTEADAAAMFAKLKDEGYSQAYRAKVVTIAKAMARAAVRRGLMTANPFDHLKAGSQANRERTQFIPGDVVRRLIDSLPDPEWRLAVALARWGGLRTPSELFALTWSHILWDRGRIVVPTPKLEHLPGREVRVIPMFKELLSHLNAAWEAAEPGAVYVVPRLREMSGNLSTQLRKYIERAGLEPWPRTWQNLRASRATELADAFPGHVASAWLGHTDEIADRHYRTVTDDHFDRAVRSGAESGAVVVQNAVQTGAAGTRQTGNETAEVKPGDRFGRLGSTSAAYCSDAQVGATGFEPVTSTV